MINEEEYRELKERAEQYENWFRDQEHLVVEYGSLIDAIILIANENAINEKNYYTVVGAILSTCYIFKERNQLKEKEKIRISNMKENRA